MAHQVETMAYAGQVPWHGLGVPVSNDLTPQQMQEKAGLNWKVRELDSFIEIDGEKTLTGLKSLVREDNKKILTNVGENWNPVQNDDAFNFFSEYCMSGDMEMHTAGSLKGGQMVWALAKVKESFDLFGDDKVDSYLLFSNPHQYGKSIDIRFTPIRVVCNNTLTMSLESKADRSVKVGHRTAFDAESVKQTLGLAHEKFAKYKEMAQFLASKKMTSDNYIAFLNEVFPRTSGQVDSINVDTISRSAKQALSVLETQPGAEYGEGTWWQAFNSVTFITDHVQGRNAENRLHSQWFGFNQLRKVKAAEKAVEYAMSA
jgi:phage/plasmid-like protein (TIGR03299 family)